MCHDESGLGRWFKKTELFENSKKVLFERALYGSSCTFGSWSGGPINATETVGSQNLKFAELTLVGARVNVLSVELCLQQFIQHNI